MESGPDSEQRAGDVGDDAQTGGLDSVWSERLQKTRVRSYE